MLLQLDKCNNITNSLLCTPIIWNHSEKNWNGISLRVGAADVFLETGRKDYHMSGPEERQRAVDLYSATPMTTAQVVKHLGYPTRQCLERWLAKGPRYAGHMAKPIIPLETRTKTIELVLDGMQQKQTSRQLGVGVVASRCM